MSARIINIEGKELVILSRIEFDDLLERAGVIPPLPKPSKDGSVPAIEFARLNIAREIIRRRLSAGLSQLQLAKQVGIMHQTITELEAGRQIPSAKIMKRIESILPALTVSKLN